MKREPWALVQSPRLAVNVNDRMLTFAIIAQVSTAGDDHRENGCPAHRSRGRAQLCGDPNPGQGTSASPNCSDEALRSIGPLTPVSLGARSCWNIGVLRGSRLVRSRMHSGLQCYPAL